MKKWKTKANPTDPSHWADVSNMWPTGRGSYEVSDIYASSGTAITATNEDTTAIAVWAFKGLTATRAYYIGAYLWELDSTFSTATDRTGALGADAVSSSTGGHACQYGDVTIVTRGTGGTLISSTGGNFAAIAGSPSARFVVVQSNAVVAFNTSANSDAWAASDVGDYTNWTTGEAASGRILENNGPITGAVPYGNDIIVFKADSIFRMTYVGGIVKWQIQKVWNGTGMVDRPVNGGSPCCSTAAGVFFPGPASYSGGGIPYYIFDGVSPPRQVNLETKIGTAAGTAGVPVYDPRLNMVAVCAQTALPPSTYQTDVYYYSLSDDAWGSAASISTGGVYNPLLILRGDDSAVGSMTGGSKPARPLLNGITSGTGSIYYRIASTPGSLAGSVASSAYIQTHKMSLPQNGIFGEDQTTFGPATPILRRRDAYSSGSPALALTVDTYTEAHDTSAAATASVTESTIRDRFDFTKSASFCQLKLTATDTDIEIDDISVKMAPAGKL